jgi:hypothetical protein
MRYEVSGGDIRNAVLKAALAAAALPGPDSKKIIRQHQFQAGIEEVIASKRVMQQSIFADDHLQRSSPLVAIVLSSTALFIAIIALALALLK